jgi:transposase
MKTKLHRPSFSLNRLLLSAGSPSALISVIGTSRLRLDAYRPDRPRGIIAQHPPRLAQLLAEFPRATVALEAGTHSPWISRYLTELGATVMVANPRKLHAISRSERKCDRRDAQMLARLARVDPALLHPIQHGAAQAQHDLLGLKLRDALVRTRVNLINAVRFTLKSLGHTGAQPLQRIVSQNVLADMPADCLPVVQPLLTVLAQVTEQIKPWNATWCNAAKRLSRHPTPPTDCRGRSTHRPCASS